MGFRSSPYNSIRTYLVAEEIIRGGRHHETNAFRWSRIMLNLPGTEGYKPSLAWITKRRADGSLASDLVTFVDDQRVTAPDEGRMEEAGHTVSTRESYLGLQDALRKIRAPKGLQQPGA